MKKKILLTFVLSILLQRYCLSQFTFEDNGSRYRTQLNIIEGIQKQFNLEKNNEFELRFWILPEGDTSIEQSVFILTNKANQWGARMFKNFINELIPGCKCGDCWRLKPIKEISLKHTELDKLWENLMTNNVLTIPNCCSQLDKNGDLIFNDKGTRFTIELISRKAFRSYTYHCPEKIASEHDSIQVYRNMANIVSLILDLAGLKEKVKC